MIETILFIILLISVSINVVQFFQNSYYNQENEELQERIKKLESYLNNKSRR